MPSGSASAYLHRLPRTWVCGDRPQTVASSRNVTSVSTRCWPRRQDRELSVDELAGAQFYTRRFPGENQSHLRAIDAGGADRRVVHL